MSAQASNGEMVKMPSPLLSRRTWLLLASLYSTQYMSLCFFVVALVAILRDQGASLETISSIYVLGLVWPLKLLWAPWIDRFGSSRLGHYRGWLLLTQGLLVLSLLLIGMFDLAENFSVIYGLCFLAALISATQDIAVDGLICRLLRPEQRGIANGLQIGGGLVANMVGGGAMLMAYPLIGWTGSLVALASITAVSFLQLLWFHEPVWQARTISAGRLFLRLGSFWRQPGRGIWLLILLLFPVGSGMAYAVITPMLVDGGWALPHIGLAVNIFGSFAGMLAALATGWFMVRSTRRVALLASGMVLLAGVAGLFLLTDSDTAIWFTGAAVSFFFLCYNPASVVLATVMMDQAAKESPATDYTLQFTLHQSAAIAAMSGSAALSASLGYANTLTLAAAGAATATLLVLLLRLTPARVENAPEVVSAAEAVEGAAE